MSLPSIQSVSTLTLRPELLTPTTFAPFGTVIATPLDSSLTSYPSTIPSPLYPVQQPKSVPANQSTALKTSPISHLTNNYSAQQPGYGLMSIFSSFPRQNIYASTDESGARKVKLKLGILERHPYTTQTFCPFNYSKPAAIFLPTYFSPDKSDTLTTSSNDTDKTYMLIIVAPTIRDPSANPPNPPDLTGIRAFLAPLNHLGRPNMAVTYAPGTWHAPMVVLGSRRVDFLVTQFANGIGEDDCQEVLIGSGPDASVLTSDVNELRYKNGIQEGNVEVDVNFLVEGWAEDGRKVNGTVDGGFTNMAGTSQKAKL